jgi:transposase InsO family protein
LAVRARHPHWGAQKLLAIVRRRDPATAWPARATVCNLLTRHGCVVPRRPRRVMPSPNAPLAAMDYPNATWTTDFKGEARTRDGVYCYPFTLRDGFSRYVLRCDALTSRSSALTRQCFERAFRAYGLPERIRSDNGEPFAGPGLARLSRLNLWWIRLGVVPERIALGRPDQNGAHEQFHAVLKAETMRPPAATRPAQQRRFRAFRREYNEVRPHASLGDQPPAHVYHPSARPLPARLPPLEYAGHCDVRRVSAEGCISWHSRPLFLSKALRGEDIALEEVADGIWTLYFARLALARFDERTRTLRPLPAPGAR